MPFIRKLDLVDIVDGRHAGARGMVDDILLCAHGSGVVLVWVQVFNMQTGGCDCMQFAPDQLRRTKMRPLMADYLKAIACAASDEQQQEREKEREAA